MAVRTKQSFKPKIISPDGDVFRQLKQQNDDAVVLWKRISAMENVIEDLQRRIKLLE